MLIVAASRVNVKGIILLHYYFVYLLLWYISIKICALLAIILY